VCWIQQWHDVVLDELSLVARGAATLPKMVFERRQRTYPSAELDERTPGHSRKVNAGEPWPARDEETTQHHERDKCKMYENEEVGCRSKQHLWINLQRRHTVAALPKVRQRAQALRILRRDGCPSGQS